MPCPHDAPHHVPAEAIACSLERIADALEAVNDKLPSIGTPEELAQLVNAADSLIEHGG